MFRDKMGTSTLPEEVVAVAPEVVAPDTPETAPETAPVEVEIENTLDETETVQQISQSSSSHPAWPSKIMGLYVLLAPL